LVLEGDGSFSHGLGGEGALEFGSADRLNSGVEENGSTASAPASGCGSTARGSDGSRVGEDDEESDEKKEERKSS